MCSTGERILDRCVQEGSTYFRDVFKRGRDPSQMCSRGGQILQIHVEEGNGSFTCVQEGSRFFIDVFNRGADP
jgi:hypothetical protein